jgi:hypothetical protein
VKSLVNAKQLTKVGVLASTFLPLSSLAVATGPESPCGTDLTLNNGANCAASSSNATSLFSSGGVFQTVSNVLIFIVGAIAVIMLIIGGLRYVISQGDKGNVESAKNTILYAVIGIVVAVMAYAIVNFVAGSLTGTPTATGS